ncbi:MAG: CYTH domain-containing protein [bacterium]|nr:CYTH domain-containing protein [bacterium]
MIEVEKKFQPTEEQLTAMLEGAEFVGEVVNHDVYYDYPDYRLHREGSCFRKRNNNFELKIKLFKNAKKEIEDEQEIKRYFGTNAPLQDFIDNNLLVLTDFKNTRKKYKKEGFSIDLDNMDFGYTMCEMELMVEREDQIDEARNLLAEFMEQYGIEDNKIPTKRAAYLMKYKPELYKELYGDK